MLLLHSIKINLDNIKYIKKDANENRTFWNFMDDDKLVFENIFYEDMKKMMNFKGYQNNEDYKTTNKTRR